jgi:hypothetical protein
MAVTVAGKLINSHIGSGRGPGIGRAKLSDRMATPNKMKSFNFPGAHRSAYNKIETAETCKLEISNIPLAESSVLVEFNHRKQNRRFKRRKSTTLH